MPTYEYECESHHRFERRQSFHEEPVSICPTCSGKARRVFHSVPVFFKGSGWYVTDYGGSNGASPSKSEAKSDKSDKTEAPSSSSPSSKPSPASS